MTDLEILLQEYRNQIETIDREILYLLSRRKNLAESIGNIKIALGYDTLQEERWKRVTEYVQKYSDEFGIESSCSKEIWDIIHKYSLQYQKK